MATVTDISVSPGTVEPGGLATATVTLTTGYGSERCDIRVTIPGLTTIGYKSDVTIAGTTTTDVTIGSPTSPGDYECCADTEDCVVINP